VIDAYPLFASVCVSLANKSSVFFDKCHFLLEHYPSEPCTWYAVGSFYFMKNKLEEAKQFYR
jgi:anaphase-promoting complex subunit 6